MPVARSIVFCDVDETLIACKSLFDFQRYYLAAKCGDAGARRAERIRRGLLAQAAAGGLREHTNREYYRGWAGERAAEVEQVAERWWNVRSGQPGFLIAATLAELAGHRAAGAAIVLVSGSFPAVLRPVAEHVGATRILCTVPQLSAGRFTGRVDGAPMIGEAKREAVRRVLRSCPSADPTRCFAYGDHVSDLPMLAEVGHPVVVGASPEVLRGVPHARALPAR